MGAGNSGFAFILFTVDLARARTLLAGFGSFIATTRVMGGLCSDSIMQQAIRCQAQTLHDTDDPPGTPMGSPRRRVCDKHPLP